MPNQLQRRTNIPDSGTNQHYYHLRVKEVVRETEDAISIIFERPDSYLEYKSGQFLTLIMEIDGSEVRRSYSFSSSPFTDEHLAVTIKRVEGGLMSNYLNEQIKPGDEIQVMEPMGTFTTEFAAGNKRHLIMFAGGSGITPFMSHIKSLLIEEPDSIASLIYANRNINSIIFKQELEELQRNYEGRFRLINILDDAPVNWQGHSGLLNHEMLTRLFERIPDWGPDKTVYLMCGPEGMMNNVETLLSLQNISKELIFKESFVVGTIGKEEKKESLSEDGLHEVTVIYDGEEFKFEVEPGVTILESALDQGIDLPYSCQWYQLQNFP
jgi:ring-1,2-phenylacetyl-CoA epoxidase subunit PaaE